LFKIQVSKAIQNYKRLFDKATLVINGDAGQEGEDDSGLGNE
jgi:hypothetical protein